MIIIKVRIIIINNIDKIVDRIHGKVGDIITTILYTVIGTWTIYSLLNIRKIISTPIIEKPNPTLHGILILICLLTFYFSLLGKYYKKPSRRLFQYIVIVFSMTVFSFNYLAETFNSLFINTVMKIRNIDVIPMEILEGNLRVVTIILPLSITLPMLILSLEVFKDKNSKNKLREYEAPLLLPTIHKTNETTIDLEICKDIATGLPCVIPEKVLYGHMWIQGGTGSGKTSLVLIPKAEQLLRKKAYLQLMLKTIAHNCLKNNIARIKIPITNKWFNENFDIELIEPIAGYEKEFFDAFDKYTLGIISKEEIVYEKNVNSDTTFELKPLKSDDYEYHIEIETFKNNMIVNKYNIILKKRKETIIKEFEHLTIETQLITNNENLSDVEIKVENMNARESVDINTNQGININSDQVKVGYKTNETNDKLEVIITTEKDNYNYLIKVLLKGSGRLVPRNLGMTIVAPDGELIKTIEKNANEYGIKMHRIDPIMEEIKKGGIAKFNPLIGDSPEKIGDIVASILVSMDVGSQSKVNPYFTNASVRAVRNLVILLKVSYPHLYNREPTLVDVLNCLNNFNQVNEPVEYVERNPELMRRWQSVIDYMKTSFQSPPLDHDSKPVQNSTIGSQRKKTQEAIGGIINQLDNLLSREEVRYILCNEKESINLANVLRKGECVGVSTRQGNLGARLGRAFALFFILSLQNEILSRYAENENPEVPHFLDIDEFPMYCNESTETFFSFSRKYKCSVTIAIQNMGQLKNVSEEFGETIFTNTTTKILLPGANLQDRKYWSDFFGNTNELEIMTGVSTNSIFAENPNYTEQMRGTLTEKRNVSEENINNLIFEQLYYSYTNKKGRKSVGKGTSEFCKLQDVSYMKTVFDFEPFCLSEKEYNDKIQKEKEKEERNKKQKELEKIEENAKSTNEFFKETNNDTIQVEQPKKIKPDKYLSMEQLPPAAVVSMFLNNEEMSKDNINNMPSKIEEHSQPDNSVTSVTEEVEEEIELFNILLREEDLEMKMNRLKD